MPRFDSWPGEFPIEEWDPEFRRRVSPDGKTYGNVQEEPARSTSTFANNRAVWALHNWLVVPGYSGEGHCTNIDPNTRT
jgi:hypothetical protein